VKILVPVKQVPDPNALRFDAQGNFAPNTARVVNEYDQYALEAAILLKESLPDVNVTVVSIGPASARDAISRGLAMGADQGILIQDDGAAFDTLATAKVLAGNAGEGAYDLIFVGQETSDGGSGNVGPQLAALLELPLVTNVVGLERADSGTLTLEREVEDGRHVVEVDPPVVICALTGLNEPRYPSLKGIMAARRKPIDARDGSAAQEATVSWGALRTEERTVEGVLIETDAESAVQQLVELLRARDLL
jgi:electron transfer flavoprotein beta subunit